jgi:hypothetical protein
MSVLQRFVLLIGLSFLAVAGLGFVASGFHMDMDMNEQARILSIFPTNLHHNLVHLAFGVWGVLATRRWLSARRFARASGVLYLLLVPIGLASPTLGGWMPIGGADIILHATLGAVLALSGFLADTPPTVEPAAESVPA